MSLENFAKQVVSQLRSAGHEAYFVGGCVRDRLMGIVSKDIDVTTSALPDQVKMLFPRTVAVGEAFNVILVLSEHEENPYRVEVATFRKDVGILDGRHPAKVELATAQEDVQRRDFTINGMLYDPVKDEILDWVGGQKDLQTGIIRSIGVARERLSEDYLRMMRAVRFTSRFRFQMDEELWQAIRAECENIQRISAERIFDELTRMLTEGQAHIAIQMLDDCGLLEQVLPEALKMKGVAQPPEYHPEGDVWVHTLLLLEQLPAGCSPLLAWGCLLHDIGKPPTFSHEPPDRIRFNRHAQVGAEMAENILKRLKAPRSLIDAVYELVDHHLRFADVPKMKESTFKRFIRNPLFPIHLEQHRIDCLASHKNLEIYDKCVQALELLKEEDLRPAPLLRGADLLELGYRAGPLFKEILDAVETEQLEGRIQSTKDALAFVQNRWPLNSEKK